jgi:integrase
MVTKLPLPGLKRFFEKKTGKTYCYHRKSGTRLKSEFGTVAFIAELQRIEAAWKAKAPTKGTLGEVIDRYRATPEFERLKPVTKRDYERVMAYLEKLRPMPTSAITRDFVIDVRNKAFKTHKRRFANYVVQVLSIMSNIGIDLGLMSSNPAQQIKDVRKATGEKSRNRPWTAGERDAVLEAAPIQLRAPLAFMRYLGARLGDVRNMRNEAYRNGMVSFRTGKGDVDVTVPCPAALAEILDTRLPHKTHLFCSTDGGPWTEGGFHASFRKLRARLEKEGKVQPGITPHGLRHSVATDLRELGETDRAIADILGQRTTYATPTYSRTADMKRSNARVMKVLHGEKKRTDEPGDSV